MGMVEGDGAARLDQVGPSRNCSSYGNSVQAATSAAALPLRRTIIRLDEHIATAGVRPRMSQHPSLISGTSAAASISGNSTSAAGSCASSGRPMRSNKDA